MMHCPCLLWIGSDSETNFVPTNQHGLHPPCLENQNSVIDFMCDSEHVWFFFDNTTDNSLQHLQNSVSHNTRIDFSVLLKVLLAACMSPHILCTSATVRVSAICRKCSMSNAPAESHHVHLNCGCCCLLVSIRCDQSETWIKL